MCLGNLISVDSSIRDEIKMPQEQASTKKENEVMD